jgi:DNA-binding MarR family transcriptional regulator
MDEIPVDEYLCTRIRRAEQALMGHHEAVLRGYGLTMTQYTVLLALSREEGGMSGAQLARACGVTQQTMATVLSGLQKKGLIERRPSSVHAKVMIATPTERGRQLLEHAYQEVIVLERALTEAFTPAEHAAFCELLERATAILTQQTPRAENRTSGTESGSGSSR